MQTRIHQSIYYYTANTLISSLHYLPSLPSTSIYTNPAFLSNQIPCFLSLHRYISMASTSVTSCDNPQKGEFEPNGHATALQKHAQFFDRNKDGIVYPWETYQGFRSIGCGFLLSLASAIFINVGLSHKTRPGKFPSLLFPIEVKNIQRGKHGSDSEVYDSEGRFVPLKFEAIFSKHAKSNPNTLTSEELKEMLKANREPKDYFGWLASYAEWITLYNLCKDKDGLLQRETIRTIYDGSLFKQMEEDRDSAKKKAVM